MLQLYYSKLQNDVAQCWCTDYCLFAEELASSSGGHGMGPGVRIWIGWGSNNWQNKLLEIYLYK